MEVTNIVTYVSGLPVLVADLTALLLIFRVYLRWRRKSALFFSVAWLADFIMVVFSMSSNPIYRGIAELSLTLFAMLMFMGSIRLLEEELIPVPHSMLQRLAFMAPLLYLYVVLVYRFTGNADWTLTAGVSLGISGVFVFASGILLKPVESIYRRPAKLLYFSIMLFGLHLIPAALFGLYTWYLPIGFTFSTTLTILMAYSMLRLTSTQEFLKEQNGVKVPEIHTGTIILQPEEFEEILSKLKDSPVLAFLRNLRYQQDGWRVYFVTAVPFKKEGIVGTISPTELARMTEIVYRYLEETSSMGLQGVVVIDCIEYLSMYNSWESLMKFLSKLRDIIMIRGGTLIIVIEKESVEERIFNQLRKLLE
ncbi:DUF835 domain-containing protein [Thermococcus sp.]